MTSPGPDSFLVHLQTAIEAVRQSRGLSTVQLGLMMFSPDMMTRAADLKSDLKDRVERRVKRLPAGLLKEDAYEAVVRLAANLPILPHDLRFNLLSSYASWVVHERKRGSIKETHHELRSTLAEPHDDFVWLRRAYRILELASLNLCFEAYQLGTDYWIAASNGADVPAEYSTLIRRVIYLAKQRLSIVERAEVVRRHGREMGLTGKLPWYPTLSSPRAVEVGELEASLAPNYQRLAIGQTNRPLLHSPEFDHLLRSGAVDDVRLRVSDKPYRVPPEWHRFGWLALYAAFSEPTDLFDGIKVRFDDVDLLQAISSGELSVSATRYLHNKVTNWALTIEISDEKRERTELFNNGARPTLSLAERTSRHCGVLGLALTSDDVLLAVYQSRINDQGAGSIVPPGGSAEFIDVHDGDSFGAFLRRSISREIEEETVTKGGVMACLLVGCTLELNALLKPDFYGLAIMSCDFASIKHKREELYGGPLQPQPLDLESSASFRQSLDRALLGWSSVDPVNVFTVANLKLINDHAETILTLIKQARLANSL